MPSACINGGIRGLKHLSPRFPPRHFFFVPLKSRLPPINRCFDLFRFIHGTTSPVGKNQRWEAGLAASEVGRFWTVMVLTTQLQWIRFAQLGPLIYFPMPRPGFFSNKMDIKSIKITDPSSNEPKLLINHDFLICIRFFDEDGTLDIALTHAESGELCPSNRGDATFLQPFQMAAYL